MSLTYGDVLYTQFHLFVNEHAYLGGFMDLDIYNLYRSYGNLKKELREHRISHKAPFKMARLCFLMGALNYFYYENAEEWDMYEQGFQYAEQAGIDLSVNTWLNGLEKIRNRLPSEGISIENIYLRKDIQRLRKHKICRTTIRNLSEDEKQSALDIAKAIMGISLDDVIDCQTTLGDHLQATRAQLLFARLVASFYHIEEEKERNPNQFYEEAVRNLEQAEVDIDLNSKKESLKFEWKRNTVS